MRGTLFIYLALSIVCAFLAHLCAGQSTQNYDIIVFGATPSGCAAAISAAMYDSSLSIALIEPSPYIGGMSVAGGIGLRDLWNTTTMLNTIAYKWTLVNAKYYGVDYPVYQPDMYVMEQSMWSMLNEYSNIKVIVNTSISEAPGSVQKDGTTILSFTAQTWPSTAPTTFAAKVFVDATYEGDLARFGGASYTYGREARATYNETYAGVQGYVSGQNFNSKYPTLATVTPGSTQLVPYVDTEPLAALGEADDRMMGYSYRLCISPNRKKQIPGSFFPPPNYNRSDFVLLQRYIETLIVSGDKPNGPELSQMVAVLNYRSYPPGDKFDVCDGYAAFTTDAINLNRGYVNGTYAQRLAIAEATYYYVLGQLYYLAYDSEVPEYTRNNTLSYGLCNDQWPYNKYIPPQLYVREGLRIVGDWVLTQNTINGGAWVNDSITIGSWVYDIHVVSRTPVQGPNGTLIANNEGQMFTPFAGKIQAYEIPIRVLFPKRAELTNLLVPVCHSASHVAYSSTRVEPTFMQLGESTGIAAALAVQANSAVQDVDVVAVQKAMEARGIAMHIDYSYSP